LWKSESEGPRTKRDRPRAEYECPSSRRMRERKKEKERSEGMCVWECVCVCMCVCERVRKRETKRAIQRQLEWERERQRDVTRNWLIRLQRLRRLRMHHWCVNPSLRIEDQSSSLNSQAEKTVFFLCSLKDWMLPLNFTQSGDSNAKSLLETPSQTHPK
jgi:hypothetical protein